MFIATTVEQRVIAWGPRDSDGDRDIVRSGTIKAVKDLEFGCKPITGEYVGSGACGGRITAVIHRGTTLTISVDGPKHECSVAEYDQYIQQRQKLLAADGWKVVVSSYK